MHPFDKKYLTSFPMVLPGMIPVLHLLGAGQGLRRSACIIFLIARS
jgi:hypothetical protein